MSFMGPKTTSIKKKSGRITGYPPQMPEMGHGNGALTGHPAAKQTGSIKKPNR